MKRCSIALFLMLMYSAAWAQNEVIFALGKGMDGTLIQKDSISDAEQAGFDFAHQLSDRRLKSGARVQWWLVTGVAYLQGTHRGIDEHLTITQIRPVLRYYPALAQERWFAEAGLGAAYLSSNEFEEINMPTNTNFALHFALGWRINSHFNLSGRYSHFSNGYTHSPNPGLDFFSVNLHWSF